MSSEIFEAVSTRVPYQVHCSLSVAYRREEIERAIKSMGPTKAPGPQEMHALFYQHYWDIVGSDVCQLCLDVLNGSAGVADFNNTLIALISKFLHHLG